MNFNKFVMIWYEFAGVQSMLYFNFHHSTFQPAVQEDSPLPIAQSPCHFPIWEIEYVHVNMYILLCLAYVYTSMCVYMCVCECVLQP